MFDNYYLTRENASFHLVIWHRHLWGGIFQMAVMGERQFTGGNGKTLQAEKAGNALDMGGFWLCSKFRIRAENIAAFSGYCQPE